MIRKTLDILSTICLITACGVFIWVFALKPQPGPPSPVEDIKGTIPIKLEMAMFGATQKATLVEFTDFECPFCRQHAATVLPEIEKLPVQYLSINFPLENIHPNAKRAALASLCGDGKSSYYALHKKLFAMPELSTLEETECMRSAYTTQALDLHKKIVNDFGVRSTPTFFLGVRTGETVTLKRRFNSGGFNLKTLKEELAKLSE